MMKLSGQDFQLRLDVLLAVTKLVNIVGTKTKVDAVLRNLHICYSDLNLRIIKVLNNSSSV